MAEKNEAQKKTYYYAYRSADGALRVLIPRAPLPSVGAPLEANVRLARSLQDPLRLLDLSVGQVLAGLRCGARRLTVAVERIEMTGRAGRCARVELRCLNCYALAREARDARDAARDV